MPAAVIRKISNHDENRAVVFRDSTDLWSWSSDGLGKSIVRTIGTRSVAWLLGKRIADDNFDEEVSRYQEVNLRIGSCVIDIRLCGILFRPLVNV